jgi:colanic acid biosynthesis glycosyl transferase WcaI
LHSLSFAVSSLPVLIREAHRRPDVVFVIEPSFLNAMCSLVVARAFGLPCWFHIQDLELDIAFELGQFRQKGLRSMLRRLESWALRRFDVVSTISGRMIDRLESKGLERSRIVHFPNWVDTSWIHPAKSNGFRRALGVDEGKVVALYSGTLGPKQGLELVLGAARDLSSEKEIQFIVCGEGSQLASLRRSAQGLSNVLFIPLQPLERLNDLLNIADIHILPQRPEVADLVMPSKLLGMAASGRPVVAVAGPDTEVFRAVRRFGIVVPPEDPSAFAGAIRQLAGNQALRAKLGALARQYALERFGRDRILSEFEESLVKRIPHKPAKMKARQMTASG